MAGDIAPKICGAVNNLITSAPNLTVLGANVSGIVASATTSSSCSGNSATVTTNANLSGDVTSSGNTTTVAKIAGVAVGTPTGTGNVVMSSNVVATSGTCGTCTGNSATVTTNANLTGGVTSVGNAATVVTNANLTGDVTSSGNATTLGASVTAAKFKTGAGGIPAVTAYDSGGTTLTAGPAYTKVNLATKVFDTASEFSSSRFTPLIAGIYFVSAQIYTTSTGATAGNQYIATVIKNGATVFPGPFGTELTGAGVAASVNAMIPMNGSTDYLELYFYNGNAVTAMATNTTAVYTYFSACWIGPST